MAVAPGRAPAPKSARTCNGAGVISRNQGAFGFSEPCTDCRGSGSIIDHPCDECKGTGVTTRSRTINVRIPRLVWKTGSGSALPGKAKPACAELPSGDLYVTVHVRPGQGVRLVTADDLTVAVPVSFQRTGLRAQRFPCRHWMERSESGYPRGRRTVASCGYVGEVCRSVRRRPGRPSGHREGGGPAESGGRGCQRGARGLCKVAERVQRLRPSGRMGRCNR